MTLMVVTWKLGTFGPFRHSHKAPNQQLDMHFQSQKDSKPHGPGRAAGFCKEVIATTVVSFVFYRHWDLSFTLAATNSTTLSVSNGSGCHLHIHCHTPCTASPARTTVVLFQEVAKFWPTSPTVYSFSRINRTKITKSLTWNTSQFIRNMVDTE